MSPFFCLFLAATLALSAQESDPVAPWSKDVVIKPVSSVEGRHSIHTYYVTNPESPDGRHVLFYTSTHPAGYIGEVRILERATGKETVLAENVHTEDAHRVACQQWLAGGRLVAFHEVIEKKWRVVVVDVATKERRTVRSVLAIPRAICCRCTVATGIRGSIAISTSGTQKRAKHAWH